MQISVRDIASRYKGTKIGIVWSIANPLIMLVVYTFVFSEIFQARWSSQQVAENSTIEYALNLFCGLILFNLVSEAVGRAPTLITSNPNYVKKVVFPLHTLGIMTITSSLFQSLSSLVVLISAVAINKGYIYFTTLFPITWIPLLLKVLGVMVLAALGVF